jgi:hypothetical protein
MGLWREKLWYIGPEGTRAGLAKWLPENAAAAAPARANPREEFAEVSRELGGDLTGEHPNMDGGPHWMTKLDDDRGEKSMFYIAHSDGRPAGYAKNNRTGEEQRWKALALERALERFGAYLDLDGNQAGARTLVGIVVTHDLQVTFTDDGLNAQIQSRRIQNDLDRGRSIATSEQEQTATKKPDAGASARSTPERKTAVQPDGKLARCSLIADRRRSISIRRTT